MDSRLASPLWRRDANDLEDAARQIEQALALPAVKKMAEYAMLYVDRSWQNAPLEDIKIYQGMAKMVSVMESLPAMLRGEIKGRDRLRIPPERHRMVKDVGEESVRQGLKSVMPTALKREKTVGLA